MTHGMSKTNTYKIWNGMKARCKGTSGEHSKTRYHDRGITYDPRWEHFENFLADMGERPAGKDLDRKDGDKGYWKDNCRWVLRGHNNSNGIWKNKHNLPRGVSYWHEKYRATIIIDDRHIRIGAYITIEEAETAYLIVYKEWYGEYPPEYRYNKRALPLSINHSHREG